MIAAAALAVALILPTSGFPTLPEPVKVGNKIYAGASKYKGRHYVPRHEHIRTCIRHRESRNHYHAVGATGKYRGAYQFSPALRTGAAWQIQKELRRKLPPDTAKRIGTKLRQTPMNQWNIYWQDFAFWIIWDGGAGRAHWAHQVKGTECW